MSQVLELLLELSPLVTLQAPVEELKLWEELGALEE